MTDCAGEPLKKNSTLVALPGRVDDACYLPSLAEQKYQSRVDVQGKQIVHKPNISASDSLCSMANQWQCVPGLHRRLLVYALCLSHMCVMRADSARVFRAKERQM